MRQQQSIPEYRRARYFWVALVLCTAAIGLYAWHEPPAAVLKAYGGSWLGYALGVLGALLVLWLMLLGVRRRSYRSNLGTLHGWTSSHVYLGAALPVIVTLHTGFELGWNVHTAAYVLLLVVVATGALGLYAYLRYPALMTRNLGGDTLESLLLNIADLDRKCRRLALDLPDEVNAVVLKATRGAQRDGEVGGSLGRSLAGDAVRCPTRAACKALEGLGARYSGAQAELTGQLLGAMTRKSILIDRVRRDMRYRALTRLWLYAHVPLSFALLAALIAHVVSVFYFR